MTTSTNASVSGASNGKGNEDADIAAKALRLLALEMAQTTDGARRRIIAAAAPVINALFRQFLSHDIQAPDWPDRDRFILSPSMQPLACALLHLLGRSPASEDNDDTGHKSAAAEPDAEPGATKAACDPALRGLDLPLNMPGHGLAAGVGMALATRLLRERFGEEVFNHATCVLVEDRDLEPGIAQEAIAIAPWLRPHRLCVLHLTPAHDENIPRQRQRCPNHLARFAAAGWHVQQVQADDTSAIIRALEQAADQDVANWEERRPAYIALEYDAGQELPSTTFLRQEMGWEELPAGVVPGPVLDDWRLAGLRGRKAHRAWRDRVASLPEAEQQALRLQLERPFPEEFRQRMRALRMALAEQAAEHDLQALLPALLRDTARRLPELVVLTALHGKLSTAESLPDDDPAASANGSAAAAPDEDEQGQHAPLTLDVGLRPMAVAALLAGIAAHGGLRPVGVVQRRQLSTMMPLLEEAALADLSATLLVLEDDLCHAVPEGMRDSNAYCLCPADAVELVECWQLCMQQPRGTGLLFVPCGILPTLRTNAEKTNLSALGGYELFRSEGPVKVSLYAAGWTLGAALSVAQALEAEGIAGARLISVPVPHRLALQDEEHRQRIAQAQAGEAGELRLFVPPGDAGHAWSLLECGDGMVSPCMERRKPELTRLASHLRSQVLARLGQLKEQHGEPAAEATETKEAQDG